MKMTMSIERYASLLADYERVRDGNYPDMDEIADFMADFFAAEAEAIANKEPYATKTINALKHVAEYLRAINTDMEEKREIIDSYEPDIKPYTSANPWDAPGMSIKDFL